MAYHQFQSDAGPFGSFEVFYDDADLDASGEARNFDEYGNPVQPGWYWWPCFPGCLPDGEAIGPFETEQEAIADAQEY